MSVASTQLMIEPTLSIAMSTAASTELSTGLVMRPSPELCLYSRLLALPLTALDEAIEEELTSNPALARPEVRRCRRCGGIETFGRCPCRVRAPLVDGPRPEPVAYEDRATALLADAADLLEPGDRSVAEYVLADLDSRGLLDRDVAAVARDLGVDVGRVARVVDSLRAAGPPGLAASSIRECLSSQLAAIEREEGSLPVLRALLDHLDDLALGREACVVAALGIPGERLREAVRVLRRRLRPCVVLTDPPAPPPPRPDLEVVAHPDRTLTAELTYDSRAGLAVDAVYLQVARGEGTVGSRASLADRRHARHWLARAETFLTQLDRRRSTLEAVATCVVGRQSGFVNFGSDAPPAVDPRDRRRPTGSARVDGEPCRQGQGPPAS